MCGDDQVEHQLKRGGCGRRAAGVAAGAIRDRTWSSGVEASGERAGMHLCGRCRSLPQLSEITGLAVMESLVAGVGAGLRSIISIAKDSCK